MPIRLIKHEAVPKCGSFEVRFPDGRPSRFFYWDDESSRRLREQMTSEEALEQAKALARRVRDEAAQRDVANPQGRYPAAIQPSTERQSSIPR